MVSIVIPHLDRSVLLKETLASLRAQSSSDWEAVLVDDGSRPDEWAAVRAMAIPGRVRAIRRAGAARGPSACRNAGLAAAAGEHVIFLDSDDLLAPWCVEDRVAAFGGDPSADLHVFPALLFDSTPGDSDLLWNAMEGGDGPARFLGSDPPWCVSSPVWRKSALSGLGGFNEKIVYGDDADLHARALLSGLRCRTHAEAMPDCFIRRGTAGRITSGLTPETIASRFTRLVEMHALVSAQRREPSLDGTWAAECFTEAEFLLFRAPEPRDAIRAVLELWRARQPWPERWRRTLPAYFSAALAFRKRFYLGLRLLRRAAMLMLPADFFRRTTTFQSTRLSAADLAALRRRMQECSRSAS